MSMAEGRSRQGSETEIKGTNPRNTILLKKMLQLHAAF
jgi:hypothetical protein